MSYPNVTWLSRLTSHGPLTSRTIGEYRLFAVGVPTAGTERVRYWGSVNAVPLNRFSDCTSAVVNYDAENFDTAEAAATNALDRAEALIKEMRVASTAKTAARALSNAPLLR